MKPFENYKIEDAENAGDTGSTEDIEDVENTEDILEKELEEKREALGRIYDIYAIRIFRFVYLKTGSRETAEDLTSEVFLKFWKYIKKDEDKKGSDGDFLKNDKASPFIYRIARNLVIDFYRKKQFITIEIDQSVKNRILDQKQDIFQIVTLKEDVEEIKKSLRQINDDYKEVIILRHVEGLNTKEIAEITEKSEGSVRVLLHRAIKALAEVMEEREMAREKGN